MLTHVKKVKSDSLLGRHLYRTHADVVEILTVRDHSDGVGEVLREPIIFRELKGQRNDWRHILSLAIATEHDLGEDFSGAECPVEPEAYRGGLSSKCRFYNPVDLFRVPLDYVRNVGADDDSIAG